MSVEFLFGKVYVDITPEEKQRIYKSKTPYEINKNTFLTDIYDNIDTMKTSYNTLKKNVISIEKVKEKDLMNFSIEELINLMQTMSTPSVNTKERMYHLIDTYLDWCVSKGYIGLNGMKGLSKDELCKVNKMMVNYKLISKQELFDLCEQSINTGEVTAMECIPLILARYGIVGEGLSRMINLRYEEDINRDNMTVSIEENGNLLLFPIDDKFLYWVDRAHNVITDGKYEYIDEGKVIKVRSDYPNYEVDNNYVYNKVLTVFNLGILSRISFKSLEQSRKFDFLLDLRNERVLTSEDFRMIATMFNPKASPASTNTLIRSWESLTNDTVTLRYNKNKIVDNNPSETTNRIKERIGWIEKE